MSSLAKLIDHPIARATLSLLGMAITILFCLLSFMLIVTPESGWLRLIVLGGGLGLVGWWIRIFTRWDKLSTRAALRNCVIALLCAGIITAVSAILFLPGASIWYATLMTISGLGLLLLLGSLAPNRA